MIKIENEKVIVTEDGKKFRVGDNIGFVKYNYETSNLDRYICKIENIYENAGLIVGSDVEINRVNSEGRHEFLFKNMHNCTHSNEKKKG